MKKVAGSEATRKRIAELMNEGGVPRLQCRLACGPAGIPAPGLADRFGGGCGRSAGGI
jgi:hypothetical protein